jgi:hypothetical protein
MLSLGHESAGLIRVDLWARTEGHFLPKIARKQASYGRIFMGKIARKRASYKAGTEFVLGSA